MAKRCGGGRVTRHLRWAVPVAIAGIAYAAGRLATDHGLRDENRRLRHDVAYLTRLHHEKEKP